MHVHLRSRHPFLGFSNYGIRYGTLYVFVDLNLLTMPVDYVLLLGLQNGTVAQHCFATNTMQILMILIMIDNPFFQSVAAV